MNLVIFGATGNVGQRIVREALSRGHTVKAVVRDPEQSQSPDERVQLVAGDATDPESVARVSKGADVVICAISPRPNACGLPAPSLLDAARAFITGLPQAGVKRLIVVGGAGSLEVAPGVQLMNAPGFPDAYKAEAAEHGEALEVYRKEGDAIEWTFLSPAAEIHPGARTGKFRIGSDQLLSDASGKSDITFEDYAVALLNEVEKPEHVRRRFSVAY